MLRKIFSYGFVEGIAKGLNKLSILVLPFFLDTISYGKIGLLVSIEIVFPLISLLGFERAVLRFFSEKEKFPGFNKTVFSSVLWVHLLISFLLTVGYFLGFRTFFGLDVFPDLFLLVMLVYFQGTNLITLNMLRVNEDHKKYFQARLFIQVCRFIFTLAIVFITNNYLGYVIGGILTAILTNILFTSKGKENNEESYNKKTFGTLFIFSWPFIFHGISGNLLGNADKFILESFMSLYEVGLYTLAYSLGSAIMFAYIGISIYMEPLIFKQEEDKERELLLDKFLFFSIVSGLLGYILISITAKFILHHFYSSHYTLAIECIPLIAISYIAYPFYLKSNYKMTYEKKSIYIAVGSILCAGINVILNIYLIPIFGILASVYTTLISYVIQALLFVLISNKFIINREFFEVVALGCLLGIGVFYKFEFYYMLLMVTPYLVYLFNKKFKLSFRRLVFTKKMSIG